MLVVPANTSVLNVITLFNEYFEDGESDQDSIDLNENICQFGIIDEAHNEELDSFKHKMGQVLGPRKDNAHFRKARKVCPLDLYNCARSTYTGVFRGFRP